MGSTALLVLGLALAGDEAAQPATISVATFNVNFGNPDLPGLVRAIRDSKADVVALQETNGESERHLRRQFRRAYPVQHFRPPEGKYLASGFGFLSKVPLEDLRWIAPRDGLFGAWLATARVGGRPIRIANVHLTPFGDVLGRGAKEALLEVARVEGIHKKEMERIAEGLGDAEPAIVLGDLNSPPGFFANRFLAGRGFADSFAAAVKDPDRHPTWRWRIDGKDVSFRLDYIYVKGGLETASSRVVETKSSDHHLVTTTLKVLPPPEPAEKAGGAGPGEHGKGAPPR